MSTLDNINLFANGGPAQNTFEDEYRRLVAVFDSPGVMGSPPSFEEYVAMRQKSQAADTARQTMTQELGAGNVRKAYEEGFTQLPFAEQMGAYVNPVTGIPIETYETGYFADEAGFGLKSPQEFALDVLNPTKNIFQKTPIKAEDPMSAVLAPLAAAGALGGLGDLANIPKAGLMALKRYQAKTMDGGGGGIGGLPQPQQETTKDLAGYKSNTLEEAKAVSGELSPKALLQYVKSNKRTNPSNNKTGTALKQTEIDEIDFEAFEAQYPNKDYTNEDILQYIDDNRIQLYRVSRSEENPTYTSLGGGADEVELYLDEPLTRQLQDEMTEVYLGNFDGFANDQFEFMRNNFPDGINKQNYDAFVERQREFIQRTDINTSGQAPSQLTESYLANNDPTINPFIELGEPQYDVFKADGSKIDIDPTTSYEDFLDALDKGYTLKPRILDQDIANNIAENAATTKVDSIYDAGSGDEAYRYVTDDNIYEVIGNEDSGYSIRLNNEFDDTNFGTELTLDEARLQINQYEGGLDSGIGLGDDQYSTEYSITVLPDDVIEGDATIPTKYGEQYTTFRLPMGGAEDYQEHTIHIKNPKTNTRYSRADGEKHFGGSDELFHIRTSVRTDENGKKVLFVEEVQSDLHSTARSTQNDATYELPIKERLKIEKQLEQEFGLTSNNTDGNRGFGNFFYRGEPGTGGEKMIDTGTLPYLAKYIREGRTENFGSKNADDFVANFGMEKTQEIGDLVAKLQKGQLPDFPYKKDWVDIAVKEALKIGAEKGVDRVAFTNAAKQIERNNKRLDYVQDTVIEKLPTPEELLETQRFADDYERSLELHYKDYINNQHNTNEPIPTQEELYASIPARRAKAKKLDNNITDNVRALNQRVRDDVKRFKQQYPDAIRMIDELEEFEGNPTTIEDAYYTLRSMEMDILAQRANANLDITADPRNVDVTNPDLARLLDANLLFREFPQDVGQKLNNIDKMLEEKNAIPFLLDEEQIKKLTQERLVREYKLNDYKYKLENVGYKLEGDEILNPQRIQMVGDDYDNQRFGQRMLTNEEELLEEVPEQFREQVKKDLDAGKSNISLNIDNLEGSGKKFLEIYKNEIPRGIVKALKDLKVKDVKPNISDVLYSTRNDYDPNQLFTDFKYLKRQNEFELDEFYDSLYQEPYAAPATSGLEPRGDGLMLHKSIGIDLTDEMKKKIIAEGFPSMYMGGKVTKSNSMDRPISGNRREM